MFTNTDSLMYEIKKKKEDVCESFSKDKKMFDFSNYSGKSKYYGDSKELVTDKMKVETAGVGIEEFPRLMPKMYSFLVDDSSQHKKQRVQIEILLQQLVIMNKKCLLNKKCLRHSMNRIQSKES